MYRLDNWDDLKADPTCQLTTNFFFLFEEFDSQTQTHDLSLLIEGTCHHTKARSLKKIL